MQHNITIIEDHDDALKAWRERRVKDIDLVHVDAHIDLVIHQAMPIQKIFNEAGTLRELKKGLEKSLAFMHYEKDFNKQTTIGNYIYPAICEGIIKNFYWVVPGGQKEFRKSHKFIKDKLSRLQATGHRPQDGIISADILGRRIVVCTLEKLPILKHKVLLDIDTDFLVIDSVLRANNTEDIGKRKPWILPKDLVSAIKDKVKSPQITTIAYSVNGGYTPIKYKHLGDEIAYYLEPEKFKRRFLRNSRAACYFNLFCSGRKRKYYQEAIRLNPAYRAQDNNYGNLYFASRRFSEAKNEFLKILKVDPKNPGSMMGLGDIALKRREFLKAKGYFTLALGYADKRKMPFFIKEVPFVLLGLAEAELGLKNIIKAKDLLFRCQKKEPLEPRIYYLLGRVYEKEKEFLKAVNSYKDALRLNFEGIEPLWRILQLSFRLKDKDAIIKFIVTKYKIFKKEFLTDKRLSLKEGRKITGLRDTEKKMVRLEKMLKKQTAGTPCFRMGNVQVGYHRRKPCGERKRGDTNAGNSSFTQKPQYGYTPD